MTAVRAFYSELLSGGEVLVVMALKRGLEQLLETIGMTRYERCKDVWGMAWVAG